MIITLAKRLSVGPFESVEVPGLRYAPAIAVAKTPEGTIPPLTPRGPSDMGPPRSIGCRGSADRRARPGTVGPTGPWVAWANLHRAKGGMGPRPEGMLPELSRRFPQKRLVGKIRCASATRHSNAP